MISKHTLILPTSRSPYASAIALDDDSLEYRIRLTQTWVNTFRLFQSRFLPSDPILRWCRESRSNYRWLVDYHICLGAEYTNRFHKSHPQFEGDFYDEYLIPKCDLPTGFIPSRRDTREWLNNYWKKSNPTWTNRKPPRWRNK